MLRTRTTWILGLMVALAGCQGSGGSSAGDTAKEVATEIGTGLTGGLPGLVWNADVVGVAERQGYLEAQIEGNRLSRRLLFPASDKCRQVLRAGETVEYTKGGSFGDVRLGETKCVAVGSFELVELRNRGGSNVGRGRGGGNPRPRAQAVYKVVGSDEQHAFLRGRFPLVGLIDVSRGEDIQVWIPNAEPCLELQERGVASMEYRPQGSAPLVLITGDGPCGLAAVAFPLTPR